MIFVDANVPMYVMGTDQARKTEARRILDELAIEREELVTDAEVFQEILHRYSAIRRPEAIQPAFDALSALAARVFPVEEADVFQAKDILATHQSLSSRDALHVALMRRHDVARILTFDRGFDLVAGIERIPA